LSESFEFTLGLEESHALARRRFPACEPATFLPTRVAAGPGPDVAGANC